MVIHSLLEAGHFHLTSGQLEAWAGQTGSGKGQEIFRCSQCGDQIYSIYHRRSGLLLVKTATFDQREDFPPQAHIFTRSKVSWIELADGQPIFEAGYDRDVLYDPDSLARVRLATGQMAGK